MKTIKDFRKAQFQAAVQYQLKWELALLSQVTTTITTTTTQELSPNISALSDLILTKLET